MRSTAEDLPGPSHYDDHARGAEQYLVPVIMLTVVALAMLHAKREGGWVIALTSTGLVLAEAVLAEAGVRTRVTWRARSRLGIAYTVGHVRTTDGGVRDPTHRAGRSGHVAPTSDATTGALGVASRS